MAEHPLETHVLWLARRLDLSGVVVVQHAIRSLADTATEAFQPSPL